VKLVNVPNVEIVEAALNLILGDSCSQMIVDNAEKAMEMLFEPLWSAARKNWNELVREDDEFCLRMLNQLHESLFKAEVNAMKTAQKKRKAAKPICKTHWEKIFELAKLTDKSIRKVNLVSML
jgi:3-oxoacyl-[acyl-carrier-protein] synthase III